MVRLPECLTTVVSDVIITVFPSTIVVWEAPQDERITVPISTISAIAIFLHILFSVL